MHTLPTRYATHAIRTLLGPSFATVPRTLADPQSHGGLELSILSIHTKKLHLNIMGE